jgi:hypothetical protein
MRGLGGNPVLTMQTQKVSKSRQESAKTLENSADMSDRMRFNDFRVRWHSVPIVYVCPDIVNEAAVYPER